MSGATTGDSLSVETLYSEYHGWLHQVLRRRLGNADDAADLAHDAFIRLLTKPRYLSHHTARAYLSRMARGLCVDLWRRREIEQAWLDTLASHPEQETPSAEQQTAALEALMAVDAMLQRLPEPVADAFLHSMVHGLTGREIAQRLNVTERTVRNYLSKAMLACLRLQARLEGDTPDTPASDNLRGSS
ncbi:MAG: sigma-70 family RNA polymerase sigma factor [Pseudomonadota bacterium]|nr:sigma-70 family RNA polymerase sigma factor [Pseudomonadota bacterium]MEE3321536.1 sigma-70 family RNA polymerase sigma factor [Pseudomonadota bacterium]